MDLTASEAYRRDIEAKHCNPAPLIRDNPVRQAKTGFSIDLKRDQHVKKVSNM